jgi:hypothetical protein
MFIPDRCQLVFNGKVPPPARVPLVLPDDRFVQTGKQVVFSNDFLTARSKHHADLIALNPLIGIPDR